MDEKRKEIAAKYIEDRDERNRYKGNDQIIEE
jgi:hypothetical protein